jgi:hypothetical protein
VLHFRAGTKRHKIGTRDGVQAEPTFLVFFLGTTARRRPLARYASRL